MGEDKALLRIEGSTLAERAAALLSAVSSPVFEVGPGWSALPAVSEELGARGPLAAVASGAVALQRCEPLAVIVLACDMPLVTVELLHWLADHPAAGSVVPVSGDPPRPQPLCARWSWAAVEAAGGLVERGERSLQSLMAATAVELVTPGHWVPHAGPAGARALDDVDTPAELARMRALLAGWAP